MKKLHVLLIAAATLVLAGALTTGGLYLYTRQHTVPEGTILAGWDVGKMDMEAVSAELAGQLNALSSLPLKLTAPGGTTVAVTLAQAGVSYDAKAFTERMNRMEEGSLLGRFNARRTFAGSYALSVHYDFTKLKSILSPAWEQASFGLPVDATRRISDDDRVLYTPGTTSFEVNWPALENALRAAVPTQLTAAGSAAIALELPLSVKQPAVTLEALQAQGVERKIVQFSTSLGASGPGRSFNVESAAKAVNGTILPPGAVFDYGKAIAKAQTEYGFREAPVIVNGQLQPGTGGGICQVSSTLYNAAVRTGLEIVERRNHSLPVGYLPKGQDATFSEGYINFRFRNNTGKYLVIKTAVQGRVLTVKFFGTFPKNVTYGLDSRTVEVLSPPSRYVNDPSLPRGGTRLLKKGRSGYVVETYITKYVDGKAVERTRLSRDVYPAQKQVVAINRGGTSRNVPSETPERPLVEDGVRGS